jgi:hypothetical protein
MRTLWSPGFLVYAGSRVLRTVCLTTLIAALLLAGLAAVEGLTPQGRAHAEFQCAQTANREGRQAGNEWVRPLRIPPFC